MGLEAHGVELQPWASRPTVWSRGNGPHSRLGHGNEETKLVLTLVGAEGFRGAQIVMVAAGGLHSVALGTEGRMWTWGFSSYGQLGHNDEENRLVPTLLAGEALGGAAGGWGISHISHSGSEA